jgi:hypothetical protein
MTKTRKTEPFREALSSKKQCPWILWWLVTQFTTGPQCKWWPLAFAVRTTQMQVKIRSIPPAIGFWANLEAGSTSMKGHERQVKLRNPAQVKCTWTCTKTCQLWPEHHCCLVFKTWESCGLHLQMTEVRELANTNKSLELKTSVHLCAYGKNRTLRGPHST